MNWKREAEDKLRQYPAKKKALELVPLELSTLKAEAQRIRSTSATEAQVKSSGGGREDALLSNIVKREELEKSLRDTRKWVKTVNAGLAVLSVEERRILARFYMDPCQGAADQLASELHLDVKTVYKRKDSALRRFTIAMYGSVES